MTAMLAALWLAAPTIARAQSTDQAAAADAAFHEGNRLMAEGKTAEACPKFAASHRLDPGYGAVYNLAVCYETLGKTASAWAAFREAEELARKHRENDRIEKARRRQAALEPKLVKLRVAVPHAVPGLVLQRDDLDVDHALWDLALPVDPGRHTLKAAAPGKKPWSATVEVNEQGKTVLVEVPALADAPSLAKDLRAVAVPSETDARVDQSRPRGLGTQRIAALAAGGLGVAGLAVGGVFGVQSLMKWDQAKDGHCSSANACDDRGMALHADALTMAHISTAGFAVGGVGLAAATVLWLTAPSKASNQKNTGCSVSVAPLVGTAGGGVAVTGSF